MNRARCKLFFYFSASFKMLIYPVFNFSLMIINKLGIKKISGLFLCSFMAISLVIVLNLGLSIISSGNSNSSSSSIIVFAQDNNTSILTSPLNQGAAINNLSDIPETVLGQPFYTENTKSTYMRVLNVDYLPSVEVSYNGNSSIDGLPTQTIGTVVDKMGSEGAIHSKGQAIILTPTGQVIAYKTESQGYYNPDGSFSASGMILFSLPFYGSNNNTTALQNHHYDATQDNSYLEFNNVLGIYKKTVDPFGNGLTKVWKWG